MPVCPIDRYLFPPPPRLVMPRYLELPVRHLLAVTFASVADASHGVENAGGTKVRVETFAGITRVDLIDPLFSFCCEIILDVAPVIYSSGSIKYEIIAQPNAGRRELLVHRRSRNGLWLI